MNQQATLTVPVTDKDHIRGPESARITLVEYGDFECPSCGQAYHALQIMIKHFGDRVCFAFRHFPLREAHPHAELAAEAAEAAAAQQKFWGIHDLLFEHQSHLTANDLRQYAVKAGLDVERYDREMADRFYLPRVQEHIDSGNKSGVRGTPTFFINGVLHDVSFGIGRLQQAIENELLR